jgi:hypothetical protein
MIKINLMSKREQKQLFELVDIRVSVDGQTLETKTGRVIGYANSPELAKLLVTALRMLQEVERKKAA